MTNAGVFFSALLIDQTKWMHGSSVSLSIVEMFGEIARGRWPANRFLAVCNDLRQRCTERPKRFPLRTSAAV